MWWFRLREGVRFHDGTPVDAALVVDSLSGRSSPAHARAPAGSVAARLLRGSPGVIRQIRARDARTVEIVLSLPYAPLLSVLAHPAFSIVLLAAEGSAMRWYGTGPFSADEVGPERIVLESRPGHWRKRSEGPAHRGVGGHGPGARRVCLDPAELRRHLPGGGAGPPGQRDVDRRLACRISRAPDREGAIRPRQGAAGRRGGHRSRPTRPRARPAATPLPDFLPPGPGRAAAPRRSWARIPTGRRSSSPRPGCPPALGGHARGRPWTADRSREAGGRDPRLAGAAGLTITVRDTPWETARSGWPERRASDGARRGASRGRRSRTFSCYPLSTQRGCGEGTGALNYSFFRNPRLDDLLIRAKPAVRPSRAQTDVYARAQAMLAEEAPWLPLYMRLHWVVARPEVRDLRLHPSG